MFVDSTPRVLALLRIFLRRLKVHEPRNVTSESESLLLTQT